MTNKQRTDTSDMETPPVGLKRLATSRPDLKRGACYHGTGDLDAAADAVAAALRAASMVCWRRTLTDGALEVHGVQSARWYAILIRGLPQRAEWRLRAADGRLWIQANLREFRWHRHLFLALGILTLLLIAGAWNSATQEPDSGLPLNVTSYGLAALLPFCAMAYLVLGVMPHMTEIWQSVQAKVREGGGYLEPLGSGFDRRKFLHALGLLSFGIVMTVWLVVDTFSARTIASLGFPGGTLAVFAAVAFILVLLMVAIQVLAARQAVFGLRATPVLPGLVSSVALLVLFTPVFIWQGAGMVRDLPAQLKEAHRFLSGEAVTGDGMLVQPSRLPPSLLRHFQDLRVLCWQGLLIVAFAAMVGALSAFLGVYCSLYTTRSLASYQLNRHRGVYREALRGERFLYRFRLVFVASWSLFAGLVLLGLAFIVLSAIQGAFPGFSLAWFQPAELSAAAVCYALRQSVGEGPVDALVRVCWILYAFSASACLVISTGQLVREQRSDRRRLRTVVRSPSDSRQHALQRKVDAFRCTLGRVHVAVSSKSFPDASARSFGVFGQERYIQITSGCVEFMSTLHVEAILAHELAHHIEGHCRIDQILRWLGRLTFVGDGFVLALQNSWGHEEIADQTAVLKLNVPPEVLHSALQNYQNARAAWHLRNRKQQSYGVGAHADPTAEIAELFLRSPAAMGKRERWRRAWRLYREQYFHALTLHYWHPWLDERLANLIALQADGRIRL